ncbi:MAG: DUF2516 family protein [Corynebacterium sp.]|nr:DUF2516 family protein [Corynebacterium sp.]
MSIIATSFTALHYLIWGIGICIALAGIAGAALCATTRDDAFEVAGRQQKWVWVGLLVGSSVASFLNVPFLSWAGIVVIGIYWFDVRPQIQDLLRGEY